MQNDGTSLLWKGYKQLQCLSYKQALSVWMKPATMSERSTGQGTQGSLQPTGKN